LPVGKVRIVKIGNESFTKTYSQSWANQPFIDLILWHVSELKFNINQQTVKPLDEGWVLNERKPRILHCHSRLWGLFRWAQASLWGMFCYSTFLSYGVQKYISLFSLLRLVHLPLLYKHIHKKHHEWTAPIGVVSIYAHPLEHIVSGFSHGHLPLPARSGVSMGWGAVGRDAKQMLPWNLLSQKGKLSCISRKPSCRSAAVPVCTALH